MVVLGTFDLGTPQSELIAWSRQTTAEELVVPLVGQQDSENNLEQSQKQLQQQQHQHSPHSTKKKILCSDLEQQISLDSTEEEAARKCGGVRRAREEGSDEICVVHIKVQGIIDSCGSEWLKKAIQACTCPVVLDVQVNLPDSSIQVRIQLPSGKDMDLSISSATEALVEIIEDAGFRASPKHSSYERRKREPSKDSSMFWWNRFSRGPGGASEFVLLVSAMLTCWKVLKRSRRDEPGAANARDEERGCRDRRAATQNSAYSDDEESDEDEEEDQAPGPALELRKRPPACVSILLLIVIVSLCFADMGNDAISRLTGTAPHKHETAAAPSQESLSSTSNKIGVPATGTTTSRPGFMPAHRPTAGSATEGLGQGDQQAQAKQGEAAELVTRQRRLALWPACMENSTQIIDEDGSSRVLGDLRSRLAGADLTKRGSDSGCAGSNCTPSDQIQVASAELCASTCSLRPQCMYWVWAPAEHERSNGSCWLRSEAVLQQANHDAAHSGGGETLTDKPDESFSSSSSSTQSSIGSKLSPDWSSHAGFLAGLSSCNPLSPVLPGDEQSASIATQ